MLEMTASLKNNLEVNRGTDTIFRLKPMSTKTAKVVVNLK